MLGVKNKCSLYPSLLNILHINILVYVVISGSVVTPIFEENLQVAKTMDWQPPAATLPQSAVTPTSCFPHGCCQCLSMARVLEMGHCNQDRNPVMGNLCSWTSPLSGQDLTCATVGSSSYPILLSLTFHRPLSWYEGSSHFFPAPDPLALIVACFSLFF